MAEHSAVNRRVVGSSPTWGVKKKKDHPKDGTILFFAAQIKLKQIPLQKLSKAVNCKDAETLAVRDEVRRLWRSGRNFASERARSFGYHKSYCVGLTWFEQGFGSKNKRAGHRPAFCLSF